MNAPEAENGNLSLEDETKFSEVVMNEFHHANPERELEKKAVEKFESLISILVAQNRVKNKGDSSPFDKNERTLEATILIDNAFIAPGEVEPGNNQYIKLEVMPRAEGQEVGTMSLYENERAMEEDEPAGELVIRRYSEDDVKFMASNNRKFDWYGILDSTARKAMGHAPEEQ